jgi:cytochrome c oxidase accessory protein FixG
MCVIACPYGRFQSVMLDRRSVDRRRMTMVRGEPAGQSFEEPAANRPRVTASTAPCVVAVCPTGIDIRKGLQMECINCAQCIDACNDVMKKVGLPQGLIRYTSQDALARKPKRLIRARTIIYPLILLGVLGGFAFAINAKSGFDARVIRGKGNPFTIERGGFVSNSFSLRLVNRTDQPQTYSLQMTTPEQAELKVIDETDLTLSPGDSKLVPFSLRFPTRTTFGDGNEMATLKVADESENERSVNFRILGPRT